MSQCQRRISDSELLGWNGACHTSIDYWKSSQRSWYCEELRELIIKIPRLNSTHPRNACILIGLLNNSILPRIHYPRILIGDRIESSSSSTAATLR